MAGQTTPNFTNIKILEDAENISKLLPWIDSQEDLINFIRGVPLDHYDLRYPLTLLHFIKDKDDTESADFKQKIEEDAQDILLCLPDVTHREIKERLSALGSLKCRKEVVIRQILHERKDLLGLINHIDQNKKRKSDNIDIIDEDTNIKIKISKSDEGTLRVVPISNDNNKSLNLRKLKLPVLKNSFSSDSDSDTDDNIKDWELDMDIKEEDMSETEKTFNLVEYLEEVTTASRARITQLCVNRGVHLYEKPKNPHILDDLLNTLMAQDVIEIADSPPIVDFWNERGSRKDPVKAEQKISWRMKRSAFDPENATITMSNSKKRNYIQPAQMSKQKVQKLLLPENENTSPKKVSLDQQLSRLPDSPVWKNKQQAKNIMSQSQDTEPYDLSSSYLSGEGIIVENRQMYNYPYGNSDHQSSSELSTKVEDLPESGANRNNCPSGISGHKSSSELSTKVEDLPQSGSNSHAEYWPEPDEAGNQFANIDGWSVQYQNNLYDLPSTSKAVDEPVHIKIEEPTAIEDKRSVQNWYDLPSTSKAVDEPLHLKIEEPTAIKDERSDEYLTDLNLPSTSNAADQQTSESKKLEALMDECVKLLENAKDLSTSTKTLSVIPIEQLGSNDSWENNIPQWLNSTADPVASPAGHHVTIDDRDESHDEGDVLDDPEEVGEPNNVDNRLVNRLMEMFPQACPKYIRKVCSGKVWEQFNDIITVILSDEDYPKRPPKSSSPPKEIDPDEQFEIIKEFLPDADPNYLRMKCQEYGKDMEGLNEFVSNCREMKDYPTLKEYLRKKQLSAQSKQYTTEFNAENFVQLFPDPEKTFSDPKRAIEVDLYNKMYITYFFENRYDRLHKKTIKNVLDGNKYKILVSDKVLQNIKQFMKSKRKKANLPDPGENMLILQELAYLDHQDEIKAFIKNKLENEKQEFEYAKDNGLLNECQCCFDDAIMEKNTVVCPKGCKVCKDCVIKSVEVNFGEAKLEFKCLTGCEEEYSLHTLQNVLPPKMFSKIAQKKALAEVKAAGIEQLESCPFCDFAIIPGENDKIFRCLNPDCMKESCRSCKEPNHVPLRCDEVEHDAEVKTRVFIENRMTEALLRKCWKCGTSFFKEEGCNKMTCTCGATMCYICKQPVTDYKHFNGIGGDKYHLCPLYSDTNQVNKKNVLEAAEAAKAEVGTDRLKVDPTADVATHFEERRKKLPREPHLDQIMQPNFQMHMRGIVEVGQHGGYPPMQVAVPMGAVLRRNDNRQQLRRLRADRRRLYLLLNRQIQAQLNPHQGHQRPRP